MVYVVDEKYGKEQKQQTEGHCYVSSPSASFTESLSGLKTEPGERTSDDSRPAARQEHTTIYGTDLLDTEAWDRGYDRSNDAEELGALRDRLDEYCAAKMLLSRESTKSERPKDR